MTQVYGKDLKSEKLVEQWPVMGKRIEESGWHTKSFALER